MKRLPWIGVCALCAALAGAGWFACGSEPAGDDAGMDAGPLDSGRDDDGPPSDLSVDLPVDGPGPVSRDISTVLMSGGGAPCGEWAAVATTPRALPSDPTPRVLWTRRLGDDAVITAAYVGGALSALTVGPSSSLWGVGPTPQLVTMFDAAGHAQFVADLGVVPEHGAGPHSVVAAPDGSAFVVVSDEAATGSRRRTLRIDSDGTATELSREGSSSPWYGQQPIVVVGPHGRIYTADPEGGVSARCGARAGPPVWSRLATSDDGGHPRAVALLVDRDGNLLVSWEGADVVSVFGADGAELAPKVTVPSTTCAALSQMDHDNFLYTRGCGPALPELHLGGSTDTLLPIAYIGGDFHLRPDGGVWSVSRSVTGPTALRAWVAGAEVVNRSPSPITPSIPWVGEDGSLVGTDGGGSIARVDRGDGHALWSVPAGLLSDYVLDVNGVVYAIARASDGTAALVAVQGDVLPPAAGCYVAGCDARRSGAETSP